MPQLNPAPWFAVLLTTWLFLLILMTKTINSNHTTPPKMKNYPSTKAPWIWPWQ